MIQGPSPPPPTRMPWWRWRVFVAFLLIGLAIGLAIVYGREPVYRTSAIVLSRKPVAIDTTAAAVDPEQVAIQGEQLLSDGLLARLVQRLIDDGDVEIAHPDLLRDMLSVVPVADTNLLELRATGIRPEQIQRILNRWVETGETFRTDPLAQRAMAELQLEQAQLARKIETTGAELQTLRNSPEFDGDENHHPTALTTRLADSLNQARDRLIAVRTRVKTIDTAIAQGRTLAPAEQRDEITRMAQTVQRAREHLADIRNRYTQAYIDRHPALRDLPVDLEGLEQELERMVKLARIRVQDEAHQELESALDTVADLELQLDAQQRNVQTLTQNLQTVSALEERLRQMETRYADNQKRLSRIQMRNLDVYSPIQVIEWASLPNRPIYPDYSRDLTIALLVALGAALFATWLFGSG